MTPEQLTDLIMQKKWVALMSIAIWFVVRLLKSDTKIPIDIPPEYRVWLALGLAPIAGAIDKVAAGNTWTQSMIEGVIAAVMAIVGHSTIIESIRGGKEPNIPGLIKTNVPPGPGKPPTLTPPPMVIPPPPPSSGPTLSKIAFRFLFAPVFAAFLFACGIFTPAQVAKGELVAEEIACVIENAFLDDPTLNAVCKFVEPTKQASASKVAATYRKQIKQDAVMHATVCAPLLDGGAK